HVNSRMFTTLAFKRDRTVERAPDRAGVQRKPEQSSGEGAGKAVFLGVWPGSLVWHSCSECWTAAPRALVKPDHRASRRSVAVGSLGKGSRRYSSIFGSACVPNTGRSKACSPSAAPSSDGAIDFWLDRSAAAPVVKTIGVSPMQLKRQRRVRPRF